MYNETKKLIQHLSEGLLEKQHHIAMALLSAVAGESIFLLGPPGTGKSMVSRRLKMAFKDASSFEYLMSRFSTPDEIFGPVSIAKLKNDDVYERKVEGYLPSASIVFLDEIWKAGPAIQNALLTAINERIYQNGSQTLRLPMKALIAASNELPAEGEGLEALWDRFLVRLVSNCITSEGNFAKMVRQKSDVRVNTPDELLITEEKYNQWQQQIEEIVIGDDILKIVSHVRKLLAKEGKKEGVAPWDYYVSDRRWKKVFHLMQASAFLNGRQAVNLSDVMLLFHCLWTRDATIPRTLQIVCAAYTAEIDGNILHVQKLIDAYLYKQENWKKGKDLQQTMKFDRGNFKLVDYLYFNVLNHPLKTVMIDVGGYSKLSSLDSKASIYYDKYRNAYIIHVNGGSSPLDAKSSVKKVMVSRTLSGIMIDGVDYPFEIWEDISQEEEMVLEKTQEEIAQSLEQQVKMSIEQLYSQIAETDNLFVSSEDLKLVRKMLKEAKMKAEELEVKVQNLKRL